MFIYYTQIYTLHKNIVLSVLEDNGRKEPIYKRKKRDKIPCNKFKCPCILEERVKTLLEDTKENWKKWKDIRFWGGKSHPNDVNCP